MDYEDKQGPAQRQRRAHYLEGLLVCVDVVAPVHLPGLAEQDEIFEKEDMPQVLLSSTVNDELIPASQLPLLLQIHLRTEQARLPQGPLGLI